MEALIHGTAEEKAVKYENLMNIWKLHQAREGKAEIYGLNTEEIKKLAVKNEKTLVKELIELRGKMEQAWLPKCDEVLAEVLRLET